MERKSLLRVYFLVYQQGRAAVRDNDIDYPLKEQRHKGGRWCLSSRVSLSSRNNASFDGATYVPDIDIRYDCFPTESQYTH